MSLTTWLCVSTGTTTPPQDVSSSLEYSSVLWPHCGASRRHMNVCCTDLHFYGFGTQARTMPSIYKEI